MELRRTRVARRIAAAWAVSALLAVAAIALAHRAHARAAVTPASAGWTSAGPLAHFALAAGQRVAFSARVRERLDAGPYSYVRVERDAGGAAWVATLRSDVRPATRVRVLVVGRAHDFPSRRLARRFPELLFGVVRPAG